MCYSAAASAQAFLIGLLGSFLLAYLPHRHAPLSRELRALSIFFGFISLMQMWDYILWTNPPGSQINAWATKGAILTNHAEPIVLALSMRYLKGSRLPSLTRWVLLLYTCLVVPYTIQGLETVTETKVSPRSAPGLDWEWNHLPYAPPIYFLFLFSFNCSLWQGLRTPRIRNLAMVLTNATLTFSTWKYYVHSAVGRFWCFFAAASPMFFLLQSGETEQSVE
jgi:hypothetical protein